MKTEMLWANWKVESKSTGMEHGFLSQNTFFWSTDQEKLVSLSVALPEKISGSTNDSKQFSKQPEKCVVTWKDIFPVLWALF